jgi:putative PEP-CTERM system TPR-repeat lipoprotein
MPDVKNRRPSPILRGLQYSTLVLALVLSGATHAAPDAKASRLYEEALTRFEKKDVKGSIIQLKNALQIDRDMLPVHLLLGRALMADGQVAAAEVAFTDALRLGVNRAEVVVPLAEAVISQGNQPQILAEARFASAGLPPGVQAKLLLVRASAAADLGDLRESLRAIEQARAIDATSIDSWVAEVPVRIRAHQFDEAMLAADKAVRLAPSSAGAIYQRSQILHIRGDLPGALAGYGQALVADPDHVESRVSRAGLLVDMNRAADARQDVEVLRRQAPKDPRGAYLAALLAERNGDSAATKLALKEVTVLIDPVPIAFIRYRPQLLMLNGLAHYGLGERENAKPYLEGYQKLDPGAGVSKLLAQIQLAEGNVQPAVESLESYLRAHPDDAQAQALLASAHMSQGRNARATSVAKDALKRTDAPELRTVLGLSMLRSGQTADATVELETAWRKDPQQTNAAAALVGLYLQNRKNDKALAVADALVKQHPKNAAFLNLQGQARQRSGNSAGARTSFEEAARLDPGLLGPQISMARLESDQGAYDAATKRLTTLLSRDERNIELQFELATLMERRGQPDEARRWLEKAIDHSGPREFRPALALVDLHMRHGRKDEALDVAKAATAKMPGELAPQLALARAQLAKNDREGAKASLNTATRLANFDPQLQLEIGLLQQLAGNLAGAAYNFDKALAAQPDFLPAQVAMTGIEIRQRDYAKAEQRARAILAAHPQKSIGYSLIGDVAWGRGQLPAATDAYRRAHKAEPTTTTLLSLHAAVLRQEGSKPAVALVEQWVKAHPQDRRAQNELAGIYARTGNLIAARTTYDSLLKGAPNDSGLLNNLANVLLQSKSPDALNVAERALAAAPGDTLVMDTVGWALFQNGQMDRALQQLRDARLRDPSQPVIRYHLAAVLAKTGRASEAKDELKQALAGNARFEGVDDARLLLKSLP